MTDKKSIGKMGELEAAKYLERKGYSISDMNFRNKVGEIDIVAKNDRYLVFVEVKTRSNLLYGTPSESVGYRKANRIRKVAELYIQSRKLYQIQPRFDIIEIMLKGNSLDLNHIENAF